MRRIRVKMFSAMGEAGNHSRYVREVESEAEEWLEANKAVVDPDSVKITLKPSLAGAGSSFGGRLNFYQNNEFCSTVTLLIKYRNKKMD